MPKPKPTPKAKATIHTVTVSDTLEAYVIEVAGELVSVVLLDEFGGVVTIYAADFFHLRDRVIDLCPKDTDA